MNTTPQSLFRFLIGAVATAAICFLVWYFSSVVIYILISAVLAIMCRPLVCRLTRIRVRGWQSPRWLAAVLTLFTIWILFAALCSALIPLISNKVGHLSQIDFSAVLGSVEEPIRRAQDYLYRLFPQSEGEFSLTETLVETLKSVVDLSTINAAFSSIVGIALSFLVAFFSISFITFFFLKEDGLFYAMVKAMFPERYQEKVTRSLDSVSLLLARYFTGILAESLILFTAVSLVMMLFGMRAQDACFIGLIMGVMNVVPYAGPLIGGLTSAFLGLVTPIEGMTAGHTVTVIVGSLLILKGMDDFVLQPTLYSERVKAHPLEIFLVILIAGSLAGIVGMLLAIPSYTVLRVFAKEFFSQFSLVQKLTQKI